MGDRKQTCKHVIEGGQNRIVIYCGKPAKRLVKQLCLDNSEPKDTPVCGIHGNFWNARGFTVIMPSAEDWEMAEQRTARKTPSCSKCGDPTHRLPDCPK